MVITIIIDITSTTTTTISTVIIVIVFVEAAIAAVEHWTNKRAAVYLCVDDIISKLAAKFLCADLSHAASKERANKMMDSHLSFDWRN